MLLATHLRFPFLFTLVATLLVGCASANESRVTVNAWLPVPLEPQMLRVKVDDGQHVWNLTGSDFHPVGSTQHNGPTLQTANHGTLTVSYALVVPGAAATISSGAIDLPLRKDWGYGVDIHADTADPRRFCFGCAGSKAFPLASEFRSSQADSVYVVWGGNSISHPVIY
ncbi:MAG: hypothetical protein ACJ8AE_10330 [Gemmatimonadaceae bacterium]